MKIYKSKKEFIIKHFMKIIINYRILHVYMNESEINEKIDVLAYASQINIK